MNVTFKKLNATGTFTVPVQDIVFVENVKGGTQVTTWDLKKLKVEGDSNIVLRHLRRMIEDAMDSGHARHEWAVPQAHDHARREVGSGLQGEADLLGIAA